MSRTLLLGSVPALILTLALTAPTTAHAQCVQVGSTVTCAADDADGFASTDDDLDITVNPGVTVSNDDDAFELDDADNTTVVNNGTITSTGARGIDTDDGTTVTDNGAINGDNDAVRGDNNLTVTNAPGATITSANQEGVDAGDGTDANITNAGTITAGDEGIQAGLRATVVNSGTITAVDDAIQIQGDATITNSGTLTSSEEDVIDIDTGIVTNSGTLISTGPGAAGIDVDEIPVDEVPVSNTLVVQNAGLIEGDFGILVDPASGVDVQVTSSGIIRGREGMALELGDADDGLTLVLDAIVDGTADFGDGDDTLDVSGVTSAVAGGPTAFFDGGDESTADTLILGGLTLDDITVFASVPSLGSDAFRIGFLNVDGGTTKLFFEDFETFLIGGTAFSADDIAAVAPVPLPAGVLLLLSALGVTGLVARRRV